MAPHWQPPVKGVGGWVAGIAVRIWARLGVGGWRSGINESQQATIGRAGYGQGASESVRIESPGRRPGGWELEDYFRKFCGRARSDALGWEACRSFAPPQD